MSFRSQLHPTWQRVLAQHLDHLDEIENRISSDRYLPHNGQVMRALSYDFTKAKVLILGQDPYPNPDHANGLAFSVSPTISKLPASLRNIYKELESDLGVAAPLHGDLTSWAEQGVVLLNRTLTCRTGESNSHLRVGWEIFTEACVKALANAGAIAILWGAGAKEASRFFQPERLVMSAHPSPLSAYRGFFGSKPFSKTNRALRDARREAIDWALQ